MDITNWLEGTITVASAFLFYYFVQISSKLWILCLITGLFAKHILWLPYVFATPIRDFNFFYKFFHIIKTAYNCKNNNINIVEMFYKNLEKDPQKKCLYFEDKFWTYEKAEEFSNRIANVFAAEGFSKGDVVGLLMNNRLEYPGVWLGLAKLGVVTSLINTNLRQKPLAHAVKIVDCKGLIVSQEHFSALGDIPLGLVKSQHVYLFRDDPTKPHESDKFLYRGRDLNILLNNASPEIPTQRVSLNFTDRVLYIYTSGTTGLPKAANMPNSRIISFCLIFNYMGDVNTNDILYSPLPLYHSSSGILGIGAAFFLGIPVVIRKKFSVTNFWKECIKYNCTVGHYIGEMCRYLVLVPETPLDRQHKIRKFIGNGIRAKIWKTMIERFGVNDFREFYGSTEGNGNLINFTNTIGSVGFIPNLIPDFLNPYALLEYDLETGLPIRNSKGFCTRVPRGQPGLFTPLIKTNIISAFYGYVNKEDSEKKMIRDVFKKGDVYFNTGDVLMRDNYGYFYFVDRIGDTFRWKGENISSTEIENVLATVAQCEICVFGVEVTGCEGRAGMVTIVDNANTIDINLLSEAVKKSLPRYAIPIFLRITTEMDVTGTMKMKKINFQKEAYHIDIVKDPIYVYQNAKYVPLTREIYKLIQDEKFHF